MYFVVVVQAHQVQAMFPHMPFNIIMDDLRHTHSLEVTTDNILEGNIAVPSVSSFHVNRLQPWWVSSWCCQFIGQL